MQLQAGEVGQERPQRPGLSAAVSASNESGQERPLVLLVARRQSEKARNMAHPTRHLHTSATSRLPHAHHQLQVHQPTG